MYNYIYRYISLQVQRSSKTLSLAKDQVLRGPLVYLGLIELSPFSPHVHRRHFFSHWSSLQTHFFVSEPLMATENYIGRILDLVINRFETVDA